MIQDISRVKAYKIGDGCYVSIYGFYIGTQEGLRFKILDYDDVVDPLCDEATFQDIKDIIFATDCICSLADKIPEMIDLLPNIFRFYEQALVHRLKEWVEEVEAIQLLEKDGQWIIIGK